MVLDGSFKLQSFMYEPNNAVKEPNNIVKELGIFANCQNKWCLQKGLKKPQHTKCESVTNGGQTCNNPEIKYGTVTGGLPWEYSSNDYEKWCEQLGGFYASHTTGLRTGHVLYGCHGADDPEYWKWCNYWGDGTWYNRSLNYYKTYNDFITSITCTNVVEEPNTVVEIGIFAKCQNEWCIQKGLQKPQHTKCESVTNNAKTCNNPEIKYGTTTGGLPKEYTAGINFWVDPCFFLLRKWPFLG